MDIEDLQNEILEAGKEVDLRRSAVAMAEDELLDAVRVYDDLIGQLAELTQ